jgi:hypothetical protein
VQGVTSVEVPSPAELLVPHESSPLASARIRRRLTLEQAAKRAGLDPEDVQALEENRIWRFPSAGDGIAAALVYAASLGVTEREARRLACLPVGPRLVEAWSLRRWLAATAFAAAAAALLWFVVGELRSSEPGRVVAISPPPAAVPEPGLPPRSEIRVDVFNGARKEDAARSLADRLGALSYDTGVVANAGRRDYSETRVYFAPGGELVAQRLARELGVEAVPLPGGGDPRRLVVIVGRR